MNRVHVPIQVRWNDLDAYGHVNNATTLRLVEEARIHVLWAPTALERDVEGVVPAGPLGVFNASPGSDTLTFIARQEAEYLAPIPYLRSPLDIHVWVGKIGGSSFELCYEVHPPAGVAVGTIYARASTTTVLMDAASRRPRPMRDEERAVLETYVGAPIAFRR